VPLGDDGWPEGLPEHDPSESATDRVDQGPSQEDLLRDLDLEPHPDAVPDVSHQPEAEQVQVQEFDPKVRQDFDGLLYLGRLTHTFSFVGHQFVIRTLTTGEILEVGLLHAQYANTLADVKAYQAALVAACVVTVDSRPMPLPITNDVLDTALVARFEYVKRSWFPPILDAVYQQYLLLERRVDDVIRAMGNLSR